jgi:putative aldouronate transport system permease protein
MSIVQKKVTLFDVVLYIMLGILTFIFIYPIWMEIMTSFSDQEIMASRPVYLLPYGFSLENYAYLFDHSDIWNYYKNTIVYALTGCVLMLIVTTLAAYPLSIKGFKGKKLVTVFLTITMFFGGGQIPYYLLIRNLGMMDTIWVIIIPSAISAYNCIVFKTFFLNIPDSLSESAYLDGANHLQVLWYIIVPLSKALLATFSLFYIVGKWNMYMENILYLKQPRQTIQVFLQQAIGNVRLTLESSHDTAKIIELSASVSPKGVQAAAVMLTITPILCVYPFLQKHFAQGVLVGSIKA